MLHGGIGQVDAGQGNTFGGAAGPSTAEGKSAFTFGNINSGGAGGFNPFATQGIAGQLIQPLPLIIIGATLVGAAWFLRKK